MIDILPLIPPFLSPWWAKPELAYFLWPIVLPPYRRLVRHPYFIRIYTALSNHFKNKFCC